MLRKIARKLYHTLSGTAQKNADVATWKEIDSLSKKAAPVAINQRVEHPPLPQRLNNVPMAIKLGDNDVLARLYTNQKIFLDGRDISLAPHLMLDGVWEAHVSRAIETLL